MTTAVQERYCGVGTEGTGERETVRGGHQDSREGFGYKEGICRVFSRMCYTPWRINF